MNLDCWEHFNHGADVGVRGFGGDKCGAFVQVALALTAVITNPLSVAQDHNIQIKCYASEDDLLLNEWLNALIYEMSTRHMFFGRFQVHLDNYLLRAKIWGEEIDLEKHEPRVEVKGATFTELQVRQEPEGHWSAQCVVDV